MIHIDWTNWQVNDAGVYRNNTIDRVIDSVIRWFISESIHSVIQSVIHFPIHSFVFLMIHIDWTNWLVNNAIVYRNNMIDRVIDSLIHKLKHSVSRSVSHFPIHSFIFVMIHIDWTNWLVNNAIIYRNNMIDRVIDSLIHWFIN